MICSSCKNDKTEEEFSWKKRGIRRQSKCKDCTKKYGKKHYENNKTDYKERAKANTPIYRERNRRDLCDYLSTHPCVDCGQSDIRVLDLTTSVLTRLRMFLEWWNTTLGIES